MLSRTEYQSFKSVMKTLNRLKASQSDNTRDFEGMVLTPLLALFGTLCVHSLSMMHVVWNCMQSMYILIGWRLSTRNV